MSRRFTRLAGLLLASLFGAACSDDVSVGTSELESPSDAGDAGAERDAEGGGPGLDASDDELSRIAEQLTGSWSLVFGDRTFTLFLSHSTERKGSLSVECTRGGQDCGETQDGGIPLPFPPGILAIFRGEYFVLERNGNKFDVVFVDVGIPWQFVFDPARQSLTLTTFGVPFLKDDPPRTPSG